MKQFNNVTIKLKIADIIIQMQSRFALEPFTEDEERKRVAERFNNFFYNGRQKPHIRIKVKIVDKLPKTYNQKPLFTTYHPDDGSQNWSLFKKDNSYIYKCPLKNKKQLMLVNKTFDKVTAYLLPKDREQRTENREQKIESRRQEEKEFVWNISDIIYDFLQVLLINYFAHKKDGIFTHAVGIKDLDGKGLIFVGKSGAGKSTIARLWYNCSKAMVLNDDRIIVRESNGRFFIHGSPWHGAFSDYLKSRIESAPLEKLFFIHHSLKNKVKRISEKETFNLLYPALFPTFWEKDSLENIISFAWDLIKSVPCYSLGFVNNKRVIEFVKKV